MYGEPEIRDKLEKAGMPPEDIDVALKSINAGIGTVDTLIDLWRTLNTIDLSPPKKEDNAENTQEN